MMEQITRYVREHWVRLYFYTAYFLAFCICVHEEIDKFGQATGLLEMDEFIWHDRQFPIEPLNMCPSGIEPIAFFLTEEEPCIMLRGNRMEVPLPFVDR